MSVNGEAHRFKPADIVDVDAVQKEFDEVHLNWNDRRNSSVVIQSIVDLLNLLLGAQASPLGKGLGAQTRYQSDLIRCRALITSRIPSAFRGGAGIEFSDGFHQIAEVVALFPSTFDGVVDLTICNSLSLAEAIHQRCKHSLVLATSDVTYPDFKMPFYLATIELLARHTFAYEDAVEALRQSLRRRFK